MRDTVYEGVRQSMVFEDGPHAGQAKGLEVVLEKCHGKDFMMGTRKDKLAEIMARELDFLAEKSILEKEADAQDNIIVFCVKFHPEHEPH